MPNVAFVRNEVKEKRKLYELIADCLAGEQAVKNKKTKYLPMPNADDTSTENLARYDAYRTRAQFYNVTARTRDGMSGYVFLREPVINVPALLQSLVDDATGTNVSLVQSAKGAVNEVLGYGRAGLWVDYPHTGEGATQEQVANGEAKPILKVYEAGKIINWRHVRKGAKLILSLVVIEETYDEPSITDKFELKTYCQWRVLELNASGQYEVSVWRKTKATYTTAEGPFVVKDHTGKPFEEILFTFIGVVDNDSPPDYPPLYDLASLNIGHYRNSADYEESCFLVGQPTPWFSGLTTDWVKDVLKGKVQLGSRAAIPLPINAAAGLLQAAENSMPKEAMEHKEAQMKALGAKLVEEKTVQRTATEADIDNTSETSTLATVANNVTKAFQKGLEWAAQLAGATGEIEFKIHSNLGLSKMTPDERRELIAEWQAGAITFTEMRDGLHQAGIATEDDAIAQETIVNDQAKALELMTAASTPPEPATTTGA